MLEQPETIRFGIAQLPFGLELLSRNGLQYGQWLFRSGSLDSLYGTGEPKLKKATKKQKKNVKNLKISESKHLTV